MPDHLSENSTNGLPNARSRAAQVAYNEHASRFDNVVLARRLLLLTGVCVGAWLAVVGGSLASFSPASSSSSLAATTAAATVTTTAADKSSPPVGMVFKALKDFLSLEDTFTKVFSARVPAERLLACLRRSDLGVVRVLADAAQLSHKGGRAAREYGESEDKVVGDVVGGDDRRRNGPQDMV